MPGTSHSPGEQPEQVEEGRGVAAAAPLQQATRDVTQYDSTYKLHSLPVPAPGTLSDHPCVHPRAAGGNQQQNLSAPPLGQ